MVFSIHDSIYKIVKKDEKIKAILFELGFEEIVKPGRLQSVGRVMTLAKGARMRDIDLDYIIKTFKDKGYVVTKENET